MKNNKPDGRTSKLEPFIQEIKVLKKNGYTEKTILKFLAEVKGVVVSQPALNKFIRNNLKNIEIPPEIKHVEKLPNEQVKEDALNEKLGAVIIPSGRFDWQAEVNPTDYL